MHDKNEYIIQIKKIKEALYHGLILLKVHRDIKFNQTAWLKSYIDINTELRKNKKWFQKRFFQVKE